MKGYSRNRASVLDCFVSYSDTPVGDGSFQSAEMQLAYSTAPINWADRHFSTQNVNSLKQLEFFPHIFYIQGQL